MNAFQIYPLTTQIRIRISMTYSDYIASQLTITKKIRRQLHPIREWINDNNLVRYWTSKWRYGNKVNFFMSTRIEKGSEFEGANRIGTHSSFGGTMGFGSFISWNSELVATIGRFTSIAPWVRSNHGIHPVSYPYATTCPMFFSRQKQNGYTFTETDRFKEFKEPVRIGNDV